MSTWETTGWIILSLIGFAGSALCAGSEIGTYTLNRVRLHVKANQNQRRAQLLQNCINKPTSFLTTLLVATNLMSYIATASLAVVLEAQSLTTLQSVIINTAIVTPILFIFSEVLPKDLFASHADRLMYPLARFLVSIRWILTAVGLVPLISLVATLIMRIAGQKGKTDLLRPRMQFETLMKEGAGYGLLSNEQSALARRVMDLSSRTIGDEMTPWKRVLTIKQNDPPTLLRNIARRTSHSRFPVVTAGNRRHVVGTLDVTGALTRSPESCPPITELMTPATHLPANTPVHQALVQMRKESIPIVIVTDARGQAVGIVTMKDLVEAITGELVTW